MPSQSVFIATIKCILVGGRVLAESVVVFGFCIPRFSFSIFSVLSIHKFTGKNWNLSLKLVLFSLVKVFIYADLKKVRNNSNTHCNAPSSMVIDLPYTSGTWGFMFDLSNENSFPCHGEMSVILVKPVNGW